MAISTTQIVEAELHITYVDKEGPFLKLFAQTDKNGLLVERLLYQLRDLLETKEELRPKTLSDVKVGLICCTKYNDNNYYRAKIQGLGNLHDRKVSVCFIDYGNHAEVNVTDIRLNSHLIRIFPDERVEKILEFPSLAREFFVAGIAARGEWDNQLLETLRTKLNNSEMLCSVCDLVGKKVIYKIHKADIDLISQLISTNAGFEIPFNTFIKKLNDVKPTKVSLPSQFNVPPPTVVDFTKQPPPTRMPNLSQPPPVRMMSDVKLFQHSNQPISSRPGSMPGIPGIPVRRPEMPMTAPPHPLQFSTEMLAVGVTHPVYVSHVEDGPHSFAIQIQSEVQNILIKMMTDINNHKPQPITAPLNPGSICLGRYSEDKSLCRAIVMNVIDDKVKLYFADFGNSEILPYSEIYQIPPEFVKPKVISHRFTLANIKDVYYTEDQKLLFKRLVANSANLQIRVARPEANPLKQYCDLFLKCKNIKSVMEEMLQSMPPLRYVPQQLPKRGSHVKVNVPFVLNPGRFFVQLSSNQSDLTEIMGQVSNHCRTAAHIPLTNLRAGDPCCALYEDETWYRAEILKVNPEKAFINFVDYGNQEEVEHTNLRVITADLVTKTKAQALVCCLKGYELRYNVSEEISNRLEELILEKTLTMHVLGSTDSNVLIVELSDNGQDIGTLLDATPVHNTSAIPKAAHPVQASNAGWEETSQTTASSNDWEEPKYSDTKGPRFNKVSKGERQDWKQVPNKRYRDDGGKSWRTQQDSHTTSRFNRGDRRNDEPSFEKRYNKEEEDKPWNRGEGRFNKDENRGGRFNRDEDGGGRFSNRDRDDGKRFGERKGRFNDEDKGGRYGDSDSRGGRFNSTDEDKPWKKKDEGGSWKERDNNRSWKQDRDNNDGGSGGGWKGRDGGSGGGWQNNSGGDRRSKFDGDSDFKRGGGFNRDSNFRAEGGDSFRKPAPKSPKPDTLGGIPYPTPKVGMIENTQVVYTTSPAEFYVQLNSSADELSQLMEKIAAACESGEAVDMPVIQDKTACLAQYSEDNVWYRGYIDENEFESAKVLFVDYGNQENVEHSKIKILSEDMSSLPAQAVKCRLYGVPETAELDAFSDLTENKTLQTQFVAKHFLTKSFQVVMVDEENGTNINIAMGAEDEEVSGALSKMGLTNPVISHYSAGTSLTVQMTWYYNPSNFYVQPLASHPEFRAMMQNMQAIVKTGSVKQNNQLNENDFVIARFKSDKVLYRAVVLEAGFIPKVQYVDYGNVESVDSGSVWAMEPEYATLPVQAFACSLAGVLPKGDSWPQATITDLDLHFEAESLECCIVKVVDKEPQYVVSLVKDGTDVATKIIEADFAIPDTDGISNELDTSLLIGQVLPVTLLRVEDDHSFFVQPPAANVELQSLEVVAGEGIKCTVTRIKEDASKEQLEQWTQSPASTNINILVDAVHNDGLQVTVYDAEGQLLPFQTSDVLSVDKICALPVLNRHQKVYVAHASEDGIFLHKVIFADCLPELLQKLFEFYNESEQVEQEWTEGDLCCALSVSDEQWYRARILETGSDTKVQYIDYGNSETIPVSNLRKLDSVFYTPHAFALKVIFHVTWNVPIETLLELTEEIEYNAVLFRSNNSWIVELVDTSGHSLTDKLVELGFAVALENSPFKRVVEGGRFVEGSDMPVAPTFIDSPLQLWVCVGDDIELVEALQDRLQEAAPKLAPLKEPNGIFAAKYSDELWYRAVKLNENTVRFIDYGNSEIVNMANIKELSPDFLEPSEGYAVKVELPVADFKENATERLNHLLLSEETDLEGEIMAHILFVRESYIVADISKGGKSVVEILVDEHLCTRLQSISSGFVSHTNSLSDFFIQEAGCEETLESIANIMLTAEDFEPISEIEVGSLVGALCTDDGVWYRAKVTEKSENEIIVVFIDYGNSAAPTEFRTLPVDLVAKPYMAKHCALQLPNGVSEWTQAALDKFLELSADGCTQFDVKFLNNENPVTVSLTSNGKCITEELKSLCDVIEKETDTAENTSIDFSGYDTTVYISHINNASDFYVQKQEDEAELSMIKEELSDISLFEGVDKMTDEVKKEVLGALSVEYETWYRAIVLNTVENGSEVLFIDYGNTAVATEFVKLPDTLSSKLPMAINCKFEKDDWPIEADSHLIALSDNGNTQFLMKVLKEGKPQTVSLVANNKIVEKELDQLFKLETKEEISEDINNSCTNSEERDKAPNAVIKTVFLIQVNSPDDFFIQTAEATQQIASITDQLVGATNFLQVDESSVTNGQIVAAQFDEDDLWYRAKIIDKSETEIKVLFIDYGNKVNVAKIKQLPEDLLSIPPLAMHCSLQNPGSDHQWPKKALETFNKLANKEDVTFDLRIVSEGEPNTVDLFINGESIVEHLILATGLVTENHSNQESEDLTHADLTSPSGEEPSQSGIETDIINHNVETSEEEFVIKNQVVEISHYNDPENFYVQFVNEKDELSNMKDSLSQAENFEAMLDIDDILAAKYNVDKLWYRAKILDTNADGTTVLFVDYGNSDTASEFRKLPKHLAEKKPLAKHCCLKSPRGTWSEETKEKFYGLTKIEGLTFELTVVKDGDPRVVDLFVNGRSLTNTFSADEMSQDQNEMQKMILQSVNKEIASSLENDMREITDELICNVAEKVSENTRKEMEHIASDLLLNVENQIKDNKEESVGDLTVQQEEMKNDTMTALNTTNEVDKEIQHEELKNDVMAALNTTNGVDKDTDEEEENSSQIKDECSSRDSNETLKVGIESPSANRRKNIDEQIVPGCISSVKSDDP